jgi:glycosyltransferase involved in cell wall biosynthesis
MRGEHSLVATEPLISSLGYKGLDVLVINSISAAEQVSKLGVTKALVRVVPNGVDIPPSVNEVQREELRMELGFARDDRVVGTIGRMDHNKNQAMLLRVFAALSNKWPKLRLVIIGDGPSRSALSEIASSLGISGKVRFPGIIPLASRYIPAMEICCLTSYTEGMPNVIMEALASSVPVISTSYTGSKELVEHELNGYLVRSNDDDAMANYMDQLLISPKRGQQLGIAGREKIRGEYGLSAMQSAMAQVYDDALTAKGLA